MCTGVITTLYWLLVRHRFISKTSVSTNIRLADGWYPCRRFVRLCKIWKKYSHWLCIADKKCFWRSFLSSGGKSMVVLKFVLQMCSIELVFFQLQCSEGGLLTLWNKDYLTGRKGESITTKTMACVCVYHMYIIIIFFFGHWPFHNHPHHYLSPLSDQD